MYAAVRLGYPNADLRCGVLCRATLVLAGIPPAQKAIQAQRKTFYIQLIIRKNAPAYTSESVLLFAAIVLKQIVGCAFQNVAKIPKGFELDPLGLVVDDFVEILITQPQLNI